MKNNLKELLELKEFYKKNYTDKGRKVPILHILNLENKIKKYANNK